MFTKTSGNVHAPGRLRSEDLFLLLFCFMSCKESLRMTNLLTFVIHPAHEECYSLNLNSELV